MNPDDPKQDRSAPTERHDDQGERDRKTAPPVEREHETYAGILEEDDPSTPKLG